MSKYKFEIGETVKIRKGRGVCFGGTALVLDRCVGIQGLGSVYTIWSQRLNRNTDVLESQLKRAKPKRGAIIRDLIARVESLERDRDA